MKQGKYSRDGWYLEDLVGKVARIANVLFDEIENRLNDVMVRYFTEVQQRAVRRLGRLDEERQRRLEQIRVVARLEIIVEILQGLI